MRGEVNYHVFLHGKQVAVHGVDKRMKNNDVLLL